jgi:3-deoxy-D-manno-octulosonate 8-phosphate phosphatase (KDO 8-P phosphatase)
MTNKKINLENIKLLIMDVDGVHTDGGIMINDDGIESKRFDVQDGHGIKMLHCAGYKTAIISGRETKSTIVRANQLGIEYVYQNCAQKLPVFEKLLAETGFNADEAAYIGDDVIDIPLIKRAGFGVAVANAVDELKQHADFVTKKSGGQGAVREVVEYLLKATGKWEKQMECYLI